MPVNKPSGHKIETEGWKEPGITLADTNAENELAPIYHFAIPR